MPKLKEATIVVKCSEEDKKAWKDYAEGLDQTLSMLIRGLLKEECQTPGDVRPHKPWISGTSNTNPEHSDLFKEFWGYYPRKVSKKAAYKAWGRLSLSEKKKALEGIKVHVANWAASDTEIQFVPHAPTWLNQARWEDETDRETKREIKPIELISPE